MDHKFYGPAIGGTLGLNWSWRFDYGPQSTSACGSQQCVSGSTCYNQGILTGQQEWGPEWLCARNMINGGPAFYYCDASKAGVTFIRNNGGAPLPYCCQCDGNGCTFANGACPSSCPAGTDGKSYLASPWPGSFSSQNAYVNPTTPSADYGPGVCCTNTSYCPGASGCFEVGQFISGNSQWVCAKPPTSSMTIGARFICSWQNSGKTLDTGAGVLCCKHDLTDGSYYFTDESDPACVSPPSGVKIKRVGASLDGTEGLNWTNASEQTSALYPECNTDACNTGTQCRGPGLQVDATYTGSYVGDDWMCGMNTETQNNINLTYHYNLIGPAPNAAEPPALFFCDETRVGNEFVSLSDWITYTCRPDPTTCDSASVEYQFYDDVRLVACGSVGNPPGDPSDELDDASCWCNVMVSGTVRDAATTFPIPGVTVAHGPVTAVTDENGVYSFDDTVVPAQYDFIAFKDGYYTERRTSIVVGGNAVVDFNLSVEQCTASCTFRGTCDYDCLGQNGCQLNGDFIPGGGEAPAPKYDANNATWFKSVCQGAQNASSRNFNSTHVADCCTGTIVPKYQRKTAFAISSCARELVPHQVIVNYNGRPHLLTVMTYKKCD